MTIKTESQSLAYVTQRPFESLHETDVYKACIFSANHGQQMVLESGLNTDAVLLLEARRAISKSNHVQLNHIMRELEYRDLSPLYFGDYLFLQGIHAHRQGQLSCAHDFLVAALPHYQQAGDSHRVLRTLINAQICDRDFASYTSGSLFALEQQAMRDGFFDLAGNIKKARAIEFAAQGQFTKALTEGIDAADAYQKDGCPEDRSLTNALLASLYWVNGDPLTAQSSRSRVLIEHGKVLPYLHLYESLVAGRRPDLPSTHVLSTAPWPVQILKQESVTGRILAYLKQQPATRDELIAAVWAGEEWTPAHTARLHSAITHLRKKMKVAIGYTGSRYFLGN